MGSNPLLLLLLLLHPALASAQASLFNLQWGLKNTGRPQQFEIDHFTKATIPGKIDEDVHLPEPLAQSRKVVVAVLDTGIDYKHPQLKDALAGRGFNLLTNTQDATDTHGHGTHVAGIIAAREGATDLRGVSKNAFILPIKVIQTGPNAPVKPLDTTPGAGTALTENVAKGVVTAIQNGAEIINLSLAWPASFRSQKMDAAMELAVKKNVLIVSSSGNDNTIANVYPCIYENVICVGSHGPDGSPSYFSNHGSMVDLLAPGISIMSTWPLNKLPAAYAGSVGYEYKHGTSMAAPFVSGALAELLSRGITPQEAKNRILAGSRPIQKDAQTRIATPIHFSKILNPASKIFTHGNLDVVGALNVAPRPLILPRRKAPFDLEWNGLDDTIVVPISWINHWIDAGKTEIEIEGQRFKFDQIKLNETVETPFVLKLSPNTQSALELKTKVRLSDGQESSFVFHVQIARILKQNQLPTEALTLNISGVDITQYSGVRSVVSSDSFSRLDTVFYRLNQNTLELTLVQESQFRGSISFSALTADQLLNVYRLPDGSYCALFTQADPGIPRPNYLFKMLSPTFTLMGEYKLGTDITTLNEKFKWVKHKGHYAPQWIALGFTPMIDLPAYDPWNPNAKDLKMPRLFFLENGTLRAMTLEKKQTPLQILPDHRLLIGEGNDYFQCYKVLTILDGKVIATETVSLPEYRMLLGLEAGEPVFNLSGRPSNTLFVSGNSSPGNFRVTALGENSFDKTLQRSTPLDSIRGVIGTYRDDSLEYFFVQTQFDIQFFRSDRTTAASLTQNRYSYIPSMISARLFFPVVITGQSNQGFPGVYIPASIANQETSEIVVADPETMLLQKPAALRFRMKDDQCRGLGNLIPAQASRPAQQVFFCGNTLIQIPLLITQ